MRVQCQDCYSIFWETDLDVHDDKRTNEQHYQCPLCASRELEECDRHGDPVNGFDLAI